MLAYLFLIKSIFLHRLHREQYWADGRQRGGWHLAAGQGGQESPELQAQDLDTPGDRCDNRFNRNWRYRCQTEQLIVLFVHPHSNTRKHTHTHTCIGFCKTIFIRNKIFDRW